MVRGYTEVVAKRLGDRVTHWMTLNEPQVYIDHGHRNAVHAPGLTLTTREQLLAGHHTLLAHGKAVQVLRASCSKPGRIGIAPVGQATIPATDSPEDYAAAEKVQKSVEFGNHFNNAWWFEPACLGHYPEAGLKTYAEHMPEFPDSDFNTIKQPMDFVGLNIYQGGVVKAGADGEPEHVPHAVGHPITCFDWPVTPAALRWGPYWAHKHFGLPVVITENGLASMDWVGLDGRVRDGQRIDFTRQYLLELEKAIADGAEVDGYFHWSIMDNFEWGEGYTKRFGLIHVDYQTQDRTLKDSARWYRTIIESNGEVVRKPRLIHAIDQLTRWPALSKQWWRSRSMTMGQVAPSASAHSASKRARRWSHRLLPECTSAKSQEVPPSGRSIQPP